jgi:hypothetical protein
MIKRVIYTFFIKFRGFKLTPTCRVDFFKYRPLRKLQDISPV